MNQQFGCLVALFLLFLVSSAVNAIQCGQGAKSEISGIKAGSISRSQCPNPNDVCHRYEASVSVASDSSKTNLQLLDILLYLSKMESLPINLKMVFRC